MEKPKRTRHSEKNRGAMAAPSCHTGAAHLSRPAPPKYENVIVLPQTNQLIALLTICRDKRTTRADFIFYANRIIRLLVEEGINTVVGGGKADFRAESSSRCGEDSDDSNGHLPLDASLLKIGLEYNGVSFEGKICGVSIMRAGESMEQGLRDCCRYAHPPCSNDPDSSARSELGRSLSNETRRRLFQSCSTRNYHTTSRSDMSCYWIPC